LPFLHKIFSAKSENHGGHFAKKRSKIVVGEIISLSLQDEAQCFALIFVNYE